MLNGSIFLYVFILSFKFDLWKAFAQNNANAAVLLDNVVCAIDLHRL